MINSFSEREYWLHS